MQTVMVQASFPILVSWGALVLKEKIEYLFGNRWGFDVDGGWSDW